jgi:hypothetical protein
LIKNIGFNGVDDGYTTFHVQNLTRIRYDSLFELKVKFLHGSVSDVGSVGSVSDVLIFQSMLLKTLPIAEERKKKEHN